MKMTMKTTSIEEILSDAKSIGITGHIRPDGDCVGSCMGLYNYIIENYKDVTVDVYLEEPGKEFGYIDNINIIKNIPEDIEYDVFIVLDCSDVDRIAPFVSCFNKAKKTVVIDHHVSNSGFADVSVVKHWIGSCCEVLYGLLDEGNITKAVAKCLYTGMIHDTGVFKYSSTNAETMRIAGILMEKGIDFTSIIDNSFYSRTFEQNKILGVALQKSVRFLDNRCIFTCISKKDCEDCNVLTTQLGGIVEQLRLTEGVEVAVFIYEADDNLYKVSFRSKSYVDVSVISCKFGGGGHIRAAGCNISGTPDEIFEIIKDEISLQMEENRD